MAPFCGCACTTRLLRLDLADQSQHLFPHHSPKRPASEYRSFRPCESRRIVDAGPAGSRHVPIDLPQNVVRREPSEHRGRPVQPAHRPVPVHQDRRRRVGVAAIRPRVGMDDPDRLGQAASLIRDKGDPAEIRFDALKGRVYRGTVARIAQAEETVDRTMRTEIDVDNADGRLKPGQFGRVTIFLKTRQGVRAIPSSAVFERNAAGHAICYRIENPRAVLTRIKVGEDDGVHTEVIDGLKEGERVITHAEGTITDGQQVIVKAAAEPRKK